jgi:choline dehydrogenase-like flavoprotein
MRPASSQIDIWPSYGLEINWNALFNSSKTGEAFQPPSSRLTAMGACYEESSHGFDGPLTVRITPHMMTGDVHTVFNSTFKALGIPPRCDLNGGDLRGFAVQMQTQDEHLDVREDAARAYYYPFEGRPNLMAMVNTTGTRILWSTHSTGNKAIAAGVETINQAGEIATIHANREVVLSAGAIRSPAILEHSGVGNPSILSQFSIPVIIDLPAVGENFQDQTTLGILASSTHNYTGFPVFVAHTSLQDLFGNQTSTIYQSTLARIPEYAANIAASNHGASTSATQERILKSQLDLLMHGNTPASEIAPLALENAIGAVFWPLQPFSRGSVHIASANASAPPAIDGRFLSIDFDGQVAVATAKFVREFLITEPVSSIVDVATIQPSFELVPKDASDEVWLEWIRVNGSLAPNYHHLGTCAMLPRDMGGVVDNDFRVYGTGNVRVVDMSMVPVQVAGHSTALIYGIAEWAARKMKGN